MKLRLALFFSLLTACTNLAMAQKATVDIYVSPSGSDSNSGTQAAPFQTLARARDAVRALPATNLDVHVWIGAGTYILGSSLDLDERDSGRGTGTVTYQAMPGAEPLLSGGTVVTGWQPAENNMWKAPLARSVKLRSLYVNGVRARMASVKGWASRTGEYNITAGQAPWAWSSGSKADSSVYTDIPMIHRNPDDVEITNFQLWNSNIVCVQEVAQEGNKVILKHQEPYGAIAQTCYWANFDAAGHHLVSNAYEFLKEPGQFYFDRAGQTLYYIPRPGEDMTKAAVFAPRLVHLVNICGKDPEHLVRNVVFKGLHFAHSDWNLAEVAGSHGKATVQGACYFNAFTMESNWHNDIYRNLDVPPGAIQFEHCDNIQFIRNSVEHIAAEAFALPNDANHVEIIGNVIRDVGGCGVAVGHPQHVFERDTPELVIKGGAGVDKEKYPPSMERVCRDNTVANNLIQDCTQEFYGEAGVSAFFVEGLRIEHNVVDNVAFNGVSLGWGWHNMTDIAGKATNTAKNNSVSFNRFSRVMQRFNDSGAIYTLGAQPGTTVQGNYIDGVGSTEFPTQKRYGIHHDEGSAFITTTHNVLDIGPDIWTVHAFRWGGEHDVTVDDVYSTSLKCSRGAGSNKLTNFHFNPDNVWPLPAFQIIQASGLEPAFQDIIPDAKAKLADCILPANVMVPGGTSIPIPGLPQNPARVVLTKEANPTTNQDVVSVISPLSTQLAAPATEGRYKVCMVNSGGDYHPSTGTLVVRNSPPQIQGAENGKTYSTPVQIHCEGTGILDGDLSSTGSDFTMVKNGPHMLVTTLANGLKTELSFTVDMPQTWLDAAQGTAAGVKVFTDQAFPEKLMGTFSKDSSLTFSNLPAARKIRVIYTGEALQKLDLFINDQKVGALDCQPCLIPYVGQIPTYRVATFDVPTPAGATLTIKPEPKQSAQVFLRAIVLSND